MSALFTGREARRDRIFYRLRSDGPGVSVFMSMPIRQFHINDRATGQITYQGGMSMSSINSIGGGYSATAVKTTAKKEGPKSTDTTAKSGFSEEAAVFSRTSDPVKNTATVTARNKGMDRSAIVEQMKADLQTRTDQMTGIVREMMQKQGQTLGKADDIWSFLAEGNFKNVDEAAVAQAKEDISEDGYWGVDKTSSRIVDFAVALSGNDSSKAEDMINAFKKGYEEATKAWGKELPDISKNTYDAVMDKFDQWKNGAYESSVE